MSNNKRKRPCKGIEKSTNIFKKSSPDNAVLELMRRRMVYLSDQRHIIFYLYFPTYEKAKIAEGELINLGFAAECMEPNEGKEWLCLAEKNMLPDPEILTSIRRKLERLTRELNGTYDGWETEITGEEGFI